MVDASWQDSVVDISPQEDVSVAPLFDGRPSIGVVVGTYGTIPIVHLQLAVLHDMLGLTDVLVHNDGSPDSDEMKDIVTGYGYDFSTNLTRQGHVRGDISVFIMGLLWAKERKLDYVVKVSRRLIILENWFDELLDSIIKTKDHTYGNQHGCKNQRLATFWLALHTQTWIDYNLEALKFLHTNHTAGNLEWFVSCYARKIDMHKRVHRRLPCEKFPLLVRREVLWRQRHRPTRYWEVSKNFGLPYTLEDFSDVSDNKLGISRWDG